MRAGVILLFLVGCGRLGFDPLASDADGGLDAAVVGPDASSDGSVVPDVASMDGMAPEDASADGGGSGDASTDAGTPSTRCALALATGNRNGCTVVRDGTVWCWGDNDGVLGVDPTVLGSTPEPVQIAGVRGAVDVGISINGFACALHGDGAVTCWGRNYNLLADSTCCAGHIAPTEVPDAAGFASLAVGQDAVCAATTDGTVWCWGGGTNFLGIGAGDVPNDWTGGIQQVVGLTGVERVAAGFETACALRADRTVWCWGQNTSYQLGATTPDWSAIPLRVPVDDAVSLEFGSGSSTGCVVRADDTMHCWGEGSFGELGNGTSGVAEPTPVVVLGLTPAHPPTTAVGTNQTCAIRDDGTLACWGYNQTFSPLAIGMLGHVSVPNTVVGLTAAPYLIAASGIKCAWLVDETLACWGAPDADTPVAVPFSCP